MLQSGTAAAFHFGVQLDPEELEPVADPLPERAEPFSPIPPVKASASAPPMAAAKGPDRLLRLICEHCQRQLRRLAAVAGGGLNVPHVAAGNPGDSGQPRRS